MQDPAKTDSAIANRRGALKLGATAVAGALTTRARRASAANANEKMRIGFIGPGGRGFGAHVKSLCKLHAEGRAIELAGVAEVYKTQRDMVADHIEKQTGDQPGRYVDYREMIEKENLDAVCIGTPDHWHHRQTVD